MNAALNKNGQRNLCSGGNSPAMFIRIISSVVIIFCLISIFHPDRHAKYYHFIPINNVISELVDNTFKDYNSNLKFCSYERLIVNNKEVSIKNIYKNNIFELPYRGGEYVPKNCKSKYKVAILIPYRKRKEQLRIFLNYAHKFLQNQNVHYKIFVVDQQDLLPFNRALLFNVGAVESMNAGFSCLILHDVDLIPLTTGNIYACSKQPRHMSSSIDTFRFNLPYEGLFGGVISIQADQFKRVNGMSNMFEGWGGEDDDLYRRLVVHNFIPYRFAPQLSKYTMLYHKKAKPSADRYELLHSGHDRQYIDGLNSLNSLVNYTIVERPLYTHIIIK